MTPLLKAADLKPEAFLDLLGNLHRPEDSPPARYIWLEAPDGWSLDTWSGANASIQWFGAGREAQEEAARDCIQRSTSGRLFAADGELRWRIVPFLGSSCWRTVFLGHTDWVGTSLEDHSPRLEGLDTRRESFYLWGLQTQAAPGSWIELRIPHRFRYPTVPPDASRVKIAVEQWLDNVGESHFVRLCNLEAE